MSLCVEWQGARYPNGYGHIGRKVNGIRRDMLAHRYAYEQAHGEFGLNRTYVHSILAGRVWS